MTDPMRLPDWILVKVSTELLAALQDDWSDPVTILAKIGPEGWELIVRRHECQE